MLLKQAAIDILGAIAIFLLLFSLASCGPTIRDSIIKITNGSGTQTVNIGNKSVPVSTTIPVMP